MQWAYETLVDEVFSDIFLVRENPDAIDETMRLSSLPNLNRRKYGPLFAQKFLMVTIDLGTDMATGFRSPTCVAQELSLRLVLDGVEVPEETVPALDLPNDWRGSVEDSLFEDMDHVMLYNAALDGISNDPDFASIGIADLKVSAWFVPFIGRTVNPYAANEEKPNPATPEGPF